MKRLLGVSVALVVLSMLLVPANAQASDFAKKGQVEAGGTISFTSMTPVFGGATGSASSVFSIQPYVGYFLMDGFELGLRPEISILSPSSGSSVTDLTIFLAPAYNFKLQNSTVTPFIEGLVGFTSISGGGGTSASGFSWGVHGGIKVAVTGNGLLNVALGYEQLTYTPSGVSERVGQNDFGVAVGFTVFFL